LLKKIFGQHVFGQDLGATPPKPKDSAADDPSRGSEPRAEAPASAATATPVRRGRIDIKEAIDAHVRWRQRLEDYIRGAGPLGAGDAADDDRCELGQWLHGEGQNRYGHLELFEDLKSAHTQLHERVGNILGRVRAGQRDEALAELHAVEYSRATARVKNLLAKLYVEVLCAQNPVPGHIDPHPPALAQR
jgi:hypothetical protein